MEKIARDSATFRLEFQFSSEFPLRSIRKTDLRKGITHQAVSIQLAEANEFVNRCDRWRLTQVVLEEVLDGDAGLDGLDSFFVSVFGSLVSLFPSFVSLLDSADELAPFSPLEASLPLRA